MQRGFVSLRGEAVCGVWAGGWDYLQAEEEAVCDRTAMAVRDALA